MSEAEKELNNEYLLWLDDLRTVLMKEAQLDAVTAAELGTEDNWRGYFDDGYTPREAYMEDKDYWVE